MFSKRRFFLLVRTGQDSDEPHPYWTLSLGSPLASCLPRTSYLTSLSQYPYLLHAICNLYLLVKAEWDQSSWHIVSAQNIRFFHLWLSSIWNTASLSLLRFLTSLVYSCVQTALAEGKRLFQKWLFHNLLAQICCCHTLCLSGSLGPTAISMCLASHLHDPGKWLLGKATACKMDSLPCSLGVKLAQGSLAAGGGAGRPELQLDFVARSFLVFIKILWLSFGIAPLTVIQCWSWLCCSLSYTHPSKPQWSWGREKSEGGKQAG